MNLFSGFHHTCLLNCFSVDLLNLFQKFLKWRPKSLAFFRWRMKQSDSGRDDYALLSYSATWWHHRKSVRTHTQDKSTSPPKLHHFILQLYQIYYLDVAFKVFLPATVVWFPVWQREERYVMRKTRF